jgi:hypothetical protein
MRRTLLALTVGNRARLLCGGVGKRIPDGNCLLFRCRMRTHPRDSAAAGNQRCEDEDFSKASHDIFSLAFGKAWFRSGRPSGIRQQYYCDYGAALMSSFMAQPHWNVTLFLCRCTMKDQGDV